MKISTKKIAALIVAVMMLAAALTACGGGGNNNAPAADAGTSVTGTYHAQVDMGAMLNEQVAESGIEITEPVNAELSLELKDDNNFTIALDGEALANNFVSYFKNNGKDLMTKALEAQGLSADMLDSVVAASGYDSLDAMIEELMGQIETEIKANLDEQKDNFQASGTYSIDGKTLKLTAEKDGLAVENGTINDDGSITISMKLNETATDVVFTK